MFGSPTKYFHHQYTKNKINSKFISGYRSLMNNLNHLFNQTSVKKLK